jgi:HAMP domain-containing protein
LRWRGATLALLATAATGVLAILAQQVEKGMLIDTAAERGMVSLLIKVAVNLPDALLFISFALLAREGASAAQVSREDTEIEPEPGD